MITKTKNKKVGGVKVPVLRFPEFSGEWEEKRLGEFIDFINGKPHEGDVVDDGEFNLITIDSVDISGSLKKAHRKVGVNDNSLCKGDLVVVLSDIGRGELLGMGDFIPEDSSYVLNQRMGRVRFSDDVSPRFCRISLNKNQKFFRKRGQGTSQRHIYERDLRAFPATLPSSKDEQQKIADFLGVVDEKIEGLSKKKESLERYKKSVMQKIFSQEIRFKDENGNSYPDWEEKRLGEISSRSGSGLIANQIEKNTGIYPVYGASGFFKKINFYQEENSYVGIVKDGAGVGRVILCSEKSSVVGTLNAIKPNKGVDIYFLYTLLRGLNLTKYVIGGTIPHIYYKDYKREKIRVPSFPEQQKISNFLTSLDEKISAISSELDRAKDFKKGLLQQMFV